MTAFNWKIAGQAGEGIKVAGLIFSKTCLRHGLAVHGYTEYPSLIRGGHNTFQVYASSNQALSPLTQLHLLVALNQKAIDQHQSELTDQSLVLFDSPADKSSSHLQLPLADLVKQAQGTPQIKNIIALGASCFLLGLPLDLLQQTVKQEFAGKGDQVIKLNHLAAQLGYDYAQKNWADKTLNSPSDSNQSKPPAKSAKPTSSLLINGNEAIALGAIAGGLKLYLAYPMTPATSILHFLAKHGPDHQVAVRHAEDEIGVINMAVGAGFAGARTMVATSGGGFSLMNEGLGLAGVTETPVVIVNAMRPGPASGMPTWSSQGDLLFAVHASQDEFPRIVLAPGDPQEAFDLTKLAHNLAEKYQLPVILLTDKYLSESYFTTPAFPAQHQNQRFGLADTKKRDNQQPFPRYQPTDSGLSPRSLPGQAGGVHLSNSYEHDPLGYATEDSPVRVQQVDKRNQKLTQILQDPDLVKPQLHGPQTASQTLVSWGSNKGAVLQALNSLKDVNFIHFPWVWPFPAPAFNQLVKSAQQLITLECNSTGQLNRLITQQTGLQIKQQILKYDGRPFFPEEIISRLQQLKTK